MHVLEMNGTFTVMIQSPSIGVADQQLGPTMIG